MRDDVFSSIVARDMVNSGYQVSYLDYIEFHWEARDLIIDAVFRPGLYTLISNRIRQLGKERISRKPDSI